MHILKPYQAIRAAMKTVVSSAQKIGKESFKLVSIASVSSVLACTYGVEPDDACSQGERLCIDKYASLCHHGEWYALECEKGCNAETIQCIDNKIVDGEITDCITDTKRCIGVVPEVCINGVWYRNSGRTCSEQEQTAAPK